MNEQGNGRIISLDKIRALAIVLVVLVHVSAGGLEACAVGTPGFAIFQCINIMAFTGVSLFVMISGALRLGRDSEPAPVSERTLRGAAKFILLYFVWKGVYLIIDSLRDRVFDPKQFLLDLIGGRAHYHLWYLPLAALLVLVTPILAPAVREIKNSILFLVIFFIFGILMPTMKCFDFPFKYLFLDFLSQFEFSFFTGYIGYFVLGGFLYRMKDRIKYKHKMLLFLAADLSYIIACFAGVKRSVSDGLFYDGFSTPLAFHTLLLSSSLFLLIIGREREVKPLSVIAKASLGIYLLHPLVLSLFFK
ncbi:MAG: acyltransferase [Lachnospiraceae bacterium]|nr:acyltransferase [Lachnospiraceae bacterium]